MTAARHALPRMKFDPFRGWVQEQQLLMPVCAAGNTAVGHGHLAVPTCVVGGMGESL